MPYKDPTLPRHRQVTRERNARLRALPRGRAGSLVGAARARAKRSGVPFALTVADIIPRLAAGKCEVTGIPFDLTAAKRSSRCRHPLAPSLDRLNPRLGYTPENTRVVVTIFNLARSDFGDVAVLLFIREWVRNSPGLFASL